eukprot:m.355789 g.355789  ORF g.355789 m.355789 type:complete len:174 (-) comp55943_c0_seq41:166-687(-)
MRKLCPREVVSFDILLLRTFPPSGVFPSALTEEFDRRFTAAACSWHLRADGSAHIEASVLGLKQGFSLKRSGNDLSRGRTTVCKYRMFERFMEVAPLAGLDVSELTSASYLQVPASSTSWRTLSFFLPLCITSASRVFFGRLFPGQTVQRCVHSHEGRVLQACERLGRQSRRL